MSAKRRFSVATIAAALLSVVPAPLRGQGQEETLKLDRVIRPFGKAFGEGVWLQRIVVVENRGKVDRTVKMVFETTDPSGQRALYTRVLTVPARSRRKTRAAVRLGKLREIGRKVKDMPLCETGMALRDAVTNEFLARLPDEIPRIDLAKTVIATLAGDYEKYDNMTYLDELADMELGTPKRLSSIGVTTHPDRWYGYDIADILLVTWIKPGQLRPSQIEAVLDWTRRGGVLVLAGNFSLPEMLTDHLAAAAGVSAVQVHHVNSLRQVRERKPKAKVVEQVRLKGPMPMVELCPDGAEVLFEANGLPLLTRHAVGSGWVFTLATPVGGLRDRKLHPLWRPVSQARDVRQPIDAGLFTAPAESAIDPATAPIDEKSKKKLYPPLAEQALQSIAGRRGPPRAVPVVILVVLAAATIVAGAAMRFRRRGELLWLVLIPLAVVLGGAFYVYGLAQSDPERSSFVGLISGLGNGWARVQQVNAYYSGPDAREHVTFASGGPGGTIAGIGGAGDAMSSIEIRSGATMTMPTAEVQVNSTRGFYTDTIIQSRGLAGRLTFGPSGLTGALTNHLGGRLTNSVIYVQRRTYRVGEIAADGATNIAVGTGDRLGEGDFIGELVPSVEAALRNTLMQALAAKPSFLRKVRTDPVLIGYTSASPVATLKDRRPPRQGWCGVVWPLRIDPPASGTRVVVPSGFVQRRFRRGAAVWDPTRLKFHKSTNPVDLVMSLRPHPAARRLEDASATLHIAIHAQTYRLIVSGVKTATEGPEQRVRIKAFDNPIGTITLTVADLDRFRAPDGAFVLSLKVERLGRPDRPPAAEDVVQWNFDSVDVWLEGIRR